MARLDGWRKVRNWLIPWRAESVIGEAGGGPPGARAADKQPLVAPTKVALPALRADQPASVGERDGNVAPVIAIDQFGRCGLLASEVAMFVDWLGAEARVFETLTWVFRAHQRLEMLDFPNYSGEISIDMVRSVHPRAVQSLEQLLRQLVGMPGLTVEQTYALLRQRLPGIEFPRCHGMGDLQELIAVARNQNIWCAERGTLPCGCSAVAVPLP